MIADLLDSITVRCRYDAVNFLTNIQRKTPHSLPARQLFMQYFTILDRVTTALDCTLRKICSDNTNSFQNPVLFWFYRTSVGLVGCCGLQGDCNNRIKCSWIVYAMQYATPLSFTILIAFTVWNNCIWNDFSSFWRNFIPMWNRLLSEISTCILSCTLGTGFGIYHYLGVSLSGAHFTKYFPCK